MARLVSSWSNGIQSVPKDYILPPERRPGDFVAVCKDIPVIDLQKDRSETVPQILKASQEFGLFQVINHGVSDKMMADMYVLYDELFNLKVGEKSQKFGKECVLFTSTLRYATEDVHYWKDTLIHSCHPLDEHTPSWPDKPDRYREEVGRYAIEVRKLGLKILNLIEEGLGLKKGYFDEVSQDQKMVINRYPSCPDPSLAMGIDAHNDANLITISQQDQSGLQVLKDGKWLGVEPIPNAFVVNIAYQFQIISNDKLKSGEHRVLLNSTAARTSICTFFTPNQAMVIEPTKELVTNSSPQIYKSHIYNQFVDNYFAFMSKPFPRSGSPLDHFRL